MKFRVGNEFFESSAEAYEHCIEEDISLEEIEELEEESLSIDVTSEEEENLDEETAVTEEEMNGVIVLENYNQIKDQTLRKQVLSVALGQSTGHDKKFSKPLKTSEIPEEYMQQFVQKISSGQCPVSSCQLHWSQLNVDLSESAKEELKEQLVLGHIESEHPKIYEFLKELFPIPGTPKDKREVPHAVTSNTEQCTDSEKLSREELADAIKADPELRRQFYLKAFRTLSNRD